MWTDIHTQSMETEHKYTEINSGLSYEKCRNKVFHVTAIPDYLLWKSSLWLLYVYGY